MIGAWPGRRLGLGSAGLMGPFVAGAGRKLASVSVRGSEGETGGSAAWTAVLIAESPNTATAVATNNGFAHLLSEP